MKGKSVKLGLRIYFCKKKKKLFRLKPSYINTGSKFEAVTEHFKDFIREDENKCVLGDISSI